MIMTGCPIHNREEHVEGYINSLLNLDYPLKDLRVVILVHKSTDNTFEKLIEQKKLHGNTFGGFDILKNDTIPITELKNRDYNIFADIRNNWLHCRKNEDYIFSVDSDIRIPPNSLKNLLKHDKDIVSLLVNNAPFGYEVYNFLNIKNGNIIRPGIKKPGLTLCDVTGAAYLIKRQVLDSGVRYGKARTGEDEYFCSKAKSKGFEIYCDTSIVAEHLMGDRNV